MSEREVRLLGDLADPASGAIAIGPFGSAMKADLYAPAGVPVIRGTNISATRAWEGGWVFVPEHVATRLSRSTAHANDLVLPHRGAIGEVAIVPKDQHRRYVLSTSLMKITLDPRKVEPLYVYYQLRSKAGRAEILRFASQVGTPGIGQPLASLRQVRVTLPDRREQVAVATLLAALDDKIDLNRRMNETLEAMARAIFKDWFVDFGPTRAKAESRVAYLDEQSWSLFSSHLNSSGLPDGWATGPLRECAALNPESWTKQTFPEAIEYVDLSGTKWGVIASTARLLKADAPSRAQRVLRPGDTIVGTVRPGNGSFALVDREGLTGSTGFAVLRPKRPAMREFVYLAATDAPNIERLAHLADGGAYPAVRPEVVLMTDVNLPPLPVMESFHSLVAPLVDMIQRNDAESALLAEMRDTLLPKLMSGEVTVRDAEKSLEQSA